MGNNDEMIFASNGMDFQISNEAVSIINKEKVHFYDEKLKNILEAARNVQSQDYFGDVDVEALAKKYPFIPFKYQIENVKAMLNRFEGRGVFGDQVGLGKTVEALMTAHAMFESGTIRNVLLIVNERIKEDWIKEINNKFPDIFTIHDGTLFDPQNTPRALFATLSKMAEHKKELNRVEYDIYIITDTLFTEKLQSISNLKQEYNQAKNYYGSKFEPREESDFESLKQNLENLNLTSITEKDLENCFHKFGYNNPSLIYPLLNAPWTQEKLDRLINLLYDTYSKAKSTTVRELDQENHNKLINKFQNYISEFENKKDKLENKYESWKEYNLDNIWSNVDSTIDLMIIDEIHAFYESDGDTQRGISDLLGRQRSTMEIIAGFEKKFCTLLSATPIRTTLKDVFDLLYMVDSKRFGKNKEEATDYFYNTICRVSPDELNPLSAIFDSDKQNSFFGIINNFFTRKRIKDVYYDMTQGKDGGLMSYSDIHAPIKEALSKSIQYKLAMMFNQDMYKINDSEIMAKKVFEDWEKGTINITSKDAQFLKAAIDSVIIAELKEPKLITETEQRNQAYEIVNWNRREKRGIAFQQSSDQREAMALNLVDRLDQERKSIMQDQCDNPLQTISESGFVITSFEKALDTDSDIMSQRNFLNNEIFVPFIGGLCRDAVLCYLRLSVNMRGEIGGCLAKKYKYNDDPDRNVVYDSAAQASKVDINNFNQIAIVNEQHMAGINYQDYSTFVFAHMDIKGERLLEPVDIEQWIGRIHRTGQVKECRIVTVLTTIMNAPNKDPDAEFLKWYYEVLADPMGLDLYGNNTPDIAFLQPIIVDILRAHLVDSSQNYTIDEPILKKMKLTAERDFQKYSFSELMEFYYHRNEKDYVKETIQRLCKINEFGKNSLEN